MEKEFKFKSVSQFEKFISKNEYWKVIPIKIIESVINYQGYVVVNEIEDSETLITQLKIEPCKDISNIFYKIEVIKEDLNKYAKDGIENPENCTIEKVRQELLKIRKHFGDNWKEEQLVTVDKYAELKKLIRYSFSVVKFTRLHWNSKLIPTPEINNLLLIVDKYDDNSIWIGNEFGNKLYKLLKIENLINGDIGGVLSFIINILAQKYSKISIDFSVINKTKYETLDITSDGEYTFTNLNCNSVKFDRGIVIIKNSVIDKLDITSKDLRGVTLENIMTNKLPILNISKKDVSIKNVKTFAQIDLENKEKKKQREKGDAHEAPVERKRTFFLIGDARAHRHK